MSLWHTGNFLKGSVMKYIKDLITSRNNATVKEAASLKEKKFREGLGLFLAEGAKLTFEALDAGIPVVRIFVAKSKKDKILEKLNTYDRNKKYDACEVFLLEDSVFEKISTENSPQGVISVIKHLDFFYHSDIIYKEEFFQKLCQRAICLCSVRDPGNLGSAIRSAVAFGVEQIQRDHVLFQIVPGMCGHHEKAALRGEICDQRIQKALGAALKLAHGAEGRVHDDHAILRGVHFLQLRKKILLGKHRPSLFR